MDFLGDINKRPICNNRHCGNIMETKNVNVDGSIASWYCRFCKEELIEISSSLENIVILINE